MDALSRVFARRSDATAEASSPAPPAAARVVRRQFRSLARERARGCDLCATPALDAVALYEVEFPPPLPLSAVDGASAAQLSLGIDLETDFYGNHAVVRCVRSSSPAAALPRRYLRPGHVVVAINGVDLSRASFAQVVQAVRTARAPRVIRFLDPEVLPLRAMAHELVLANRDEYGFAKDEQHILRLRQRQRQRQRQRSDYRCELDWHELIGRWGGLGRIEALLHRQGDAAPPPHGAPSSVQTLQTELRRLVMRGVPVVLRAEVWAALAGVRAYRSRYPSDYLTLLAQRPLPVTTREDIDKDVARTYPEHAYLRSARGQDELRTLLAAYALHNPEVGYCQGINFLAGMLLVLADAERAFWLLCALLRADDDGRSDGGGGSGGGSSRAGRQLLPTANYSRSMLGAQADQLVFRSLVRLELPAVAARADALGLRLELFTLHWFLCAFACTLPTASALRVWDWIFLDGQQVLFTTAIGVLKLAEPSILAATSASELHAAVKALGTDLHDDDELMVFLERISARPAPGAAGAVGSRPERGLARWLPSRRPLLRAAPAFAQKHTLDDVERLRREFRRKLERASFSALQASM